MYGTGHYHSAPLPYGYMQPVARPQSGVGETSGGMPKFAYAVIALAAVGAAWLFFVERDRGDVEVALYKKKSDARPSKHKSFYTLAAAKAYASEAKRDGWAKTEVAMVGAT